MERASQYPSFGGEVKRVLYGVGRAIDPSPHAWNERIIKGVNKILPVLSPRAQLWIAKNHVSIEKGAQIAGIAISTAETYVAFMLLGRGIQKYQVAKYDRQVNRIVATDEFMIILKKRFDTQYPKASEAFFPLAAAVIGVASMYHGKDAYARNTDMKKSMKTRFEGAYVQVAVDRAILKREPIDIDAIRNQARSSFDQLQKITHPKELMQLTHIMRQHWVVDPVQQAADRKRREKNWKRKDAWREHHSRGKNLLGRVQDVMRQVIIGTHVFPPEKISIEVSTRGVPSSPGQLQKDRATFAGQVINQGTHQPRRDHQGRWK